MCFKINKPSREREEAGKDVGGGEHMSAKSRDSFFFIVIFLTLNWRPSAMSLLTSESLLGLGVLWFSVGLMIL